MNLRKDHCRILESTTADKLLIEAVLGSIHATFADSLVWRGTLCSKPTETKVPRRGQRQGIKTKELVFTLRLRTVENHVSVQYKSQRLSATDISALASMKNVAKCDTWCELQNPVNHRVFERKLRPKPLGRGHACLGVTQCDAPHPN